MDIENSPAILEERVNGLDVRLVGVTHTPAYFEEYKSFFREQIDGAPAILHEADPVLESGNSEMEKDDFYLSTGKLAGHRGIPIYVPDSVSILFLITGLSQVLMGMKLLGSAQNDFCAGTRRDFLKGLGKSIFSMPLLLGNFWGTCAYQRLFTDITAPSSGGVADDFISYGSVCDYRNLLIAENIDRLSQQVSFEQPLPFFIRRSHLPGIHAYLANPLMRRKRLIYFPQDLLLNTKVRKYEFANGEYQQIGEI